MCLIIIAPPGIEVPLETIDKATQRNPDWWGMSFRDSRGLHIRRGQSPRSARKAWRRAPLDSERIFHARIGTSGTKDIRNTHPFDCGQNGGPRRLLFHNGMVSMPQIKAEYCDTWHLAQALRMGTDDEIKAGLIDYARTEHSRFVVQHEDPTKETLMYGKWTKRDGAYYSNDLIFPYNPPAPKYPPYNPRHRESTIQVWRDGKWVEMPSYHTGLTVGEIVSQQTEDEGLDENERSLLAEYQIERPFRTDRVSAMIDLASDASLWFDEAEQDDVFAETYERLQGMTEEEFLEAEYEMGYGKHEINKWLGRVLPD